MAISWDVQITNVNLVNKRGDIRATRTDDQSALAPRVYSMLNTPLDTVADRTLVLDTIKEWDEATVNKIASVETFLTDLEQTAIANLVAWEATR